MKDKISETKKESSYFIMVLGMIGKRYSMSIVEAYEYINKYKGMNFLYEFYDVEHTLNTEDVVEDVLAICNQNGGVL